MLTSVPTKYGAGITIYGDYYDLKALHETILKIAGQQFVQERVRDYMLALAYDVRKAFDGKREKRSFGLQREDKVKYLGVSVLWPYALTQAGLIRHFAAYHITDRKDQACLYLLEDCLMTSLLAFDLKAGKQCAEWLVRFQAFPSDYLLSFISECTKQFLFRSRTKQRFTALPRILAKLDWWSSEYKEYAAAFAKLASAQGCSPHDLEDHEEWPAFRW